jgi:hypothetical protein
MPYFSPSKSYGQTSKQELRADTGVCPYRGGFALSELEKAIEKSHFKPGIWV